MKKHFPLTPRGIIKHLDLLKPIYRSTAAYGHFGRKAEGDAQSIVTAAYPKALGYPDLLAAARQVLGEFGAAENVDEIALGDALFMLVMAHGVLPTVSDIAYVNEPGDHPQAHRRRSRPGHPGRRLGMGRLAGTHAVLIPRVAPLLPSG